MACQFGDVVSTWVKGVKKGHRHPLFHLESIISAVNWWVLAKTIVELPPLCRTGNQLADAWLAGILKTGLSTGKMAAPSWLLVPLKLSSTVVSSVVTWHSLSHFLSSPMAIIWQLPLGSGLGNTGLSCNILPRFSSIWSDVSSFWSPPHHHYAPMQTLYSLFFHRRPHWPIKPDSNISVEKRGHFWELPYLNFFEFLKCGKKKHNWKQIFVSKSSHYSFLYGPQTKNDFCLYKWLEKSTE